MDVSPHLRIVDVELVEGDLIGVRLSDGTAILISVGKLLSLNLPRFFQLPEDDGADNEQ